MFGDRSFVLAATCLFVGALASLRPAAAQAQTIDLSLNVFYTTPSNVNSGGTWELVAKSSSFGISGLEARLLNITTALNRARAPPSTATTRPASTPISMSFFPRIVA